MTAKAEKRPLGARAAGFAALAILGLQPPVGADPAPAGPNRPELARRHAANLAAAATNAALLVRPGLIADRAARTVRVLAEATGIEADKPVEFILVTPASANGYEAFAVAAATASDVDAALRFIGLTPGRPADPRALAFWPRGERVRLLVMPAGATNAAARPVEEFLWTRTTKQCPPGSGFVYVSATAKFPLPADRQDPYPIVSTYNEPLTVLDVPRQAPQGSVYGEVSPNPQRLLATNQLLDITIVPERAADQPPRVLALTCEIAPAADAATRPAAPVFTLTGPAPTPAGPLASNALAAAVAALTAAGRDPFTRLLFAPTLRLDEAHAAATFLRSLEREDGLRFEPPDPDQIYYRAFVPDEGNRRREDRLSQPPELRFAFSNDALRATLVQIAERWHDDRADPELVVTEHPLADPAALRAILAGVDPSPPVLLVFAPPAATLTALDAYVTPARTTHPLVHIFLEPAP